MGFENQTNWARIEKLTSEEAELLQYWRQLEWMQKGGEIIIDAADFESEKWSL